MRPCVQECKEKWIKQKNRIYKHKLKTPRNDKQYVRNEHFPIIGLRDYKRKCYIEWYRSGVYPKCTGRARAQRKSQWLWNYWCSVPYHHQKEMWAIGAEKHLQGEWLNAVWCVWEPLHRGRILRGWRGLENSQWERACPECIWPWVRSHPTKQTNSKTLKCRVWSLSYEVPELKRLRQKDWKS